MSKTIVEKLNLLKYKNTAVLHHPEGEELLPGLTSFDTELASSKYDLIFAFVYDLESLKAFVLQVIENDSLTSGGYLYTAYPKKGNKVYPTYIHRDSLLDGVGADEEGYVGDSDIKFARMVGMNEVFTIVGFKREARKKQASSKPSQSVDDYIEQIPAIEQDLSDTPALLALYQSLTPGYRKDWARYVYSAVQEKTRAKRREEMKKVLAAGYKTMDLYRASGQGEES